MDDEIPEVHQQVLAVCLGTLEDPPAKLLGPVVKRGAQIGGGRQLDLVTAESRVQAGCGAVDRVALGHSWS